MAHAKRIRILGLDPAATGPTGYGVVETDGRNCRTVGYGVLRPRRGGGASARLREIHASVNALIEEHRPDALALESVFTALNMRTALLLAEVRGVVLLAAAERELPVHSYSPREVKATVAGHGDADKHQVQQMVRAALRMAAVPEPADAADALAVALCHIYLAAAGERIARATGDAARPARSRTAATRIQPLR